MKNGLITQASFSGIFRKQLKIFPSPWACWIPLSFAVLLFFPQISSAKVLPFIDPVFKKISIQNDAPIDINEDGTARLTWYAGPRNSSVSIKVYTRSFNPNPLNKYFLNVYYRAIPPDEERNVRLTYQGNIGPLGAEAVYSGTLTIGQDRPSSKATETQYLNITRFETFEGSTYQAPTVEDTLLNSMFGGMIPAGIHQINTGPITYQEFKMASFSYASLSPGQWPIQILVNDLAASVTRMTDDSGTVDTPVISSFQVAWDGILTDNILGKPMNVKKGLNSMEIRLNASSKSPNIRPRSVHLMLFRADAIGDFRKGSGQEEYIEEFLDINKFPSLAWGQIVWKVDPKRFNRGNKDFTDAAYLFEAEVVPMEYSGASISRTLRILGDKPALSVLASQKDVDGVEFDFVKKKANARFDVAVSASPGGPYYLISRDVMDPKTKPAADPWIPSGLDLSIREEPWQFIAGDSPQKYFASFERIRQSMGVWSLPSEIFFRFRSIDEVGNSFDTSTDASPVSVKVKKFDSRPPSVVVDRNEGASVVIHDFGDVTPLRGTFRDRSPWGDLNTVRVYLSKNGVIVSSSPALSAPDDALIGWSLPITSKFSGLLPNGSHGVELICVDIDGNETRVPFNLIVDISAFDLKISNPLYSRSVPDTQNGKKSWSVDFKAVGKEGGYVSLDIDGVPWAKDILIGSNRNFNNRIFNSAFLSEGRHSASSSLTYKSQFKSIAFDLVIDNTAPKLNGLKSPDLNQTLLTTQETVQNVVGRPEITVVADVTESNPVTVTYALGTTIDEVNQTLSSGGGIPLSSNGGRVHLFPNMITYLGVIATDDAGNVSGLKIYPLFCDLEQPKISIRSVEQIANDLVTPDRNNLIITFSEAEFDPMPARYDVSASLSPNGPWTLVTRSVIESAPPVTPWAWNDLMRGEREWQIVKKISDLYIPLNLTLQNIRKALSIDQLPGFGNQATIYFKVRSKDFAGNIYESPSQAFGLSVDRNVPEIFLDKSGVSIIDYDRPGGQITGRIVDDPQDGSVINAQLMYEGALINEMNTSSRYGGDFSLYVPKDKAVSLGNGTFPMKIIATDADGNKSEIDCNVTIDIKPLAITIPQTMNMRIVPDAQTGKPALDLDIPVVPNSKVSLKISGIEILKNYGVGTISQLRTTAVLPSKLSDGANAAVYSITKNGQSVSKLFTVNIDNNPPTSIVLQPSNSQSPLLSTRETESNIFPSGLVRLQASASDESQVKYQFGVGLSLDAARRDMLSSSNLSNVFYPKISAGSLQYIALGVTDLAGNMAETYYPVFVRKNSPELSIKSIEQKGDDEVTFDKNILWIYFDSKEPDWVHLRYDLSVSLDGVDWKLLTRDVIDAPPSNQKWYWALGNGARWENMGGSAGSWTPYITTLSKIRATLGVDSLPVENGKGVFYVRLRGTDSGMNRTAEQTFRTETQLDPYPPTVGLDITADPYQIVDFGPHPGAIVTGWVKDESSGNNFVDVSLYKGNVFINKTRVYTDPGVTHSWQVYIPESSVDQFPNGLHQLIVKAADADGNGVTATTKINVDVISEDIKFEDPLYSAPYIRNGKTNVVFSGVFKENSILNVNIDGTSWLKNYSIGSSRFIETLLQSNERLLEGEHLLNVKITRNGVTNEKSGKIIVRIDPPKFGVFTEVSKKTRLFTTADQTDQPWNSVNAPIIQMQAAVTDPTLSAIRFAVATDPNTALRKLDSGLFEIYTNLAQFTLQPNQLTYVAFEAENKSGLKSQALIPIQYDTDAPNLEISRIDQLSQDGKTFDRNSLWIYFNSGESDNARLRYDVSVSVNPKGPWSLVTRDVVDSPPPATPWTWNYGAGSRWLNMIAQIGGGWTPINLLMSDIRDALGNVALPQTGANAYFFVRVRAVDYAGNILIGDSPAYKAVIQSNQQAPELFVNGQGGTIRIYDVGNYGGLAGNVKDMPYEPGNFTQILLMKNGVAIATTAVRTDSDVISKWELVIPESQRSFLGTGQQSLEVLARDADGNTTSVPISVNVDVADLYVNVDDPLYSRSDVLFDRTKKSSVNLRATVKENSDISLEIDGNMWVNGINVGSKSLLDERFETEFDLSEGQHQATITVNRGGQSLKRNFRIVVDNATPKILDFREQHSNQVMHEGGENVLGVTDLLFSVLYNEAHYKEGRYAISDDYGDLSRMLSSGKKFKDSFSLNLPSGSSAYLGIEIEDQAGNIARQIFNLSANTDLPSTLFEPKYFISSPEDYASSGQISAAFNGRDAVYLAGQLSKQDSPGNVEVIGFKKQITAGTDYQGHWQIMVPASAIPQGEEASVRLQITGKNSRSASFDLKFLKLSEVAKIVLDEPVPDFVKSNSFLLKGTVQSKVALESFEAVVRPENLHFMVVSNGKVVKDRWNRTDYDPSTGRFSIFVQGLEDDSRLPHSLELVAKTSRGLETTYTQVKSGQTTIPYFFVITKIPNPPTLKVSGRVEGGIVLEGTADTDSNLTIVITDQKGSVLGKSPVYAQLGESKGTWNKKLENLLPQDYEVYAYAEDPAGNQSQKVGPEKFTIFKGFGSKPKLADFSKGRETYTESSKPSISGNAGIPRAQVQIYETGNYIGGTMSDADGNFSFTPSDDLKNGWKNFIAMVFDANGQRVESDVLRIYFAVSGAPVEERLNIKPEQKRTLERQTVSFLVTSREGVPMKGARVILVDQSGDTNQSGRIDLVTPALNGQTTKSVPVRAEILLPNGIKLTGSNVIDVVAGDNWDIRFSPNGDGINDYVVFNDDDLPVKIQQFRTDEVVKVVRKEDGGRWDGRKSNGADCGTGLYLAQTKADRSKQERRALVIQVLK